MCLLHLSPRRASCQNNYESGYMSPLFQHPNSIVPKEAVNYSYLHPMSLLLCIVQRIENSKKHLEKCKLIKSAKIPWLPSLTTNILPVNITLTNIMFI